MPGMMRPDEMKALQITPDAEFQQMWRDMIIRHHQGAIIMAKTEQGDGASMATITLAKQIVTAQTAEITKMRVMMGNFAR
jgi:uncharacterized protein (DUF305 family)